MPNEYARRRAKYAAFADRELRDWLTQLMEDRSPDFLCALAEAVVKASPEDYALIRPALLHLRRKYLSLGKISEISNAAYATATARRITGRRKKTE